MNGDKKRLDELEATDEKEGTPPRDRDQAAYSPVRAGEKAERAEFPDTPGTQDVQDTEEPLIARDNMKGTPPRRGSS